MTLLQAYEGFRDTAGIGFFSGYHALEHPVMSDVAWKGRTVYFKKSTTATNLIAAKDFWRSVGIPIPILNPDGTPRGFPNDGRGSQIDVWFTGCYSLGRFDAKNAAPNCLYRQGKKVLVIPMLKHLGIEKKDSTWRQNRAGGF